MLYSEKAIGCGFSKSILLLFCQSFLKVNQYHASSESTIKALENFVIQTSHTELNGEIFL